MLSSCQNFSWIIENNEILPEEDNKPGKKLLAPHNEVWLNENCKNRPMPYIRLDNSDVIPKTATPGALVRYRLYYTACISDGYYYENGNLKTNIYFQRNVQNTRSDDYKIETGKWIIDTHINVPNDVENGIYVLDATLSIEENKIQDVVSFNVER
jgi:hypothetical protein